MEDRPYTTVMSYSHIRHAAVVGWCQTHFPYLTWSCDFISPYKMNLRCLVVKFEKGSYKTMFDLVWSERCRLWASAEDYYEFVDKQNEVRRKEFRELVRRIG